MQNTVIVLSQTSMGSGPAALCDKILSSYLNTLAEGEFLPQALLFYTEGVKLCCQGSPVLPQLKTLAEKGVRFILCRTCLDYYGLLDAVCVGEIGNMLQIVEAQAAANKVIHI